MTRTKTKIDTVFPQELNGYSFQRRILTERKGRPYLFGLYQTADGKEAIAKVIVGKSRTSFDYYSLRNEINVYTHITACLENNGIFQEQHPDIRIPRLLYSIEDKNKLVLLIERMPGNSIQDIPPQQKAAIYERLIRYLHEMGAHVPKEAAQSMALYPQRYLLFITLFSLFRAALKYFQNFSLIARSAFAYLSLVHCCIGDRANTFVHRSLEDHNILITDNTLALIDFQLAGFGNPFLEIANFLVFSWDNQETCQYFLQSDLMKSYLTDKNSFGRFKSIALYTALYQWVYGPESEQGRNKSFLQFVIDMHYHRYLSPTQYNVRKNRLSVTLGIPAYNEGANIVNLLNSVIKQKQISYILEKIVVLSDGSTDDTDAQVLQMSQQYPIIELVADGTRMGHVHRLSQLYKLNTSDIVIQADADLLLAHDTAIENLIMQFDNESVVLVGGDSQPIVTESLFELLINTWHRTWSRVRERIHNGNNFLNCNSCFMAMRKDFIQGVELPHNLISPARYVYCLAQEKGKDFRYAPQATVYFRLPPNLHDYLFMLDRYSDETSMLTERFGNHILAYYHVPRSLKIQSLFMSLLYNPIYTTAAAIQYAIIRTLSVKGAGLRNQGPMTTIPSTKKGINPMYFNSYRNL
jgi:glycosyltransferase involved in cell wall biosynthesis